MGNETNILGLVLIIGVAIIGIGLITQITSSVSTTLATTTGASTGLGEELTYTVDGVPISLSQTLLVAGSTEVVCPDTLMVEDVDYTMDNTEGTITFLNDSVTVVNDTYTSLHDEWVYLYGVEANPLVWADANTFVTFNCSDYAEVWDSGNYTLNETIAKLNVTSTGDMLNDTAYCFNSTGSSMYDGASCTIEYLFYTGEVSGGVGSDLASSGTDAMAQWGSWFGVIIVVVIAGIIITYLGFIRET